MPTYTGPIPRAPTPDSPAVDWTNWWAYETIKQNMRYEDERVAAIKLAAERAIVTDRQHLERMAAEKACAEAHIAHANAIRASAAAMQTFVDLPGPSPAPTPTQGPVVNGSSTDEELVVQFMLALVDDVTDEYQAMGRAQDYLKAFRTVYKHTGA